MTVQEAINSIHAPKGVTSIIAGVMSGDYSVLRDQNGLSSDLAKANEQVAIYQKQLDECKSDWSYWAILGDLTYWQAVRNILEAGTLNGGVLADVAKPNLDGLVVMDAIGRVEDFGEEILKKTKQLPGGHTNINDEKRLMDKTVDLWNDYSSLTPLFKSEPSEMAAAIHRIQDLIGSRIAKKTHPEIYE